MTIYNFSAGPATLPKPVLEKAQAELLNYQDSGMSVLEMSHRSPEFDKIVKDAEAVESLNRLLHEYADYIIGRQGIPYREKNIHIISVAMDAPTDEINALCGRIGRISGVNSKVVYANE